MQLALYHKFDTLSPTDSGKQHRFTWHAWDDAAKQGAFLCHAMYQSGEDMIRTSNGQPARRGEVLRLQCAEVGDCAPGHGIELKVDDERWVARDYRRLAEFILHECKSEGRALSKEQKAAICCQLASLYNLMATQYGVTYYRGMRDMSAQPGIQELKGALDEMITDPKRKAVSAWFQGIAAALLAEREPALELPRLPLQTVPQASWYHNFEVGQGVKMHHFHFYKRKDPLPQPFIHDPMHPDFPCLKISEAAYMSGKLGEKVAVFPIDPADQAHAYMERGLPLRTRLGAESLDAALGPNAVQSLTDPVPALRNAKLINESLAAGKVTRDQAVSALMMLASLYRLVATRYTSGFGYHPDGRALAPHFFDDPRADADAFDAKLHAFRKGLRKDEVGDSFVRDGMLYTRPVMLRDGASLSDYIESGPFAREAENAITIAAHAMKGADVVYRKGEDALPVWVLGEEIGQGGRIAYKGRG